MPIFIYERVIFVEIEALRSGLMYEAKLWQGPMFGGRVWVCTRFGWVLGLGANGDKLIITHSKFLVSFPTLGQRYFICMSGNLDYEVATR